jgi:hypothetical protein
VLYKLLLELRLHGHEPLLDRRRLTRGTSSASGRSDRCSSLASRKGIAPRKSQRRRYAEVSVSLARPRLGSRGLKSTECSMSRLPCPSVYTSCSKVQFRHLNCTTPTRNINKISPRAVPQVAASSPPTDKRYRMDEVRPSEAPGRRCAALEGREWQISLPVGCADSWKSERGPAGSPLRPGRAHEHEAR